jgi:4-amino-4-deoxy-L-arabinose transferase-like glycosyltransferase
MNRKHVVFFSCILLIGFFLRWWGLTSKELWFDEIVSLNKIRINDDVLGYSIHPALYFVVLKRWLSFFGSHSLGLRSLSALFSFISLPIFYLLNRVMFNKKTALISVFLLAISPFHIWYAQEARMYSMVTFFTILAVLFLYLTVKYNYIWPVVGYSISAISAIYTTYFSLLIIPTGILYVLLIKDWAKIKIIFFANTIIILLFVPGLIMFIRALSVFELFWVDRVSLGVLFIPFQNFLNGYNSSVKMYLFSFFVAVILVLNSFRIAKTNNKTRELNLLIFFYVCRY